VSTEIEDWCWDEAPPHDHSVAAPGSFGAFNRGALTYQRCAVSAPYERHPAQHKCSCGFQWDAAPERVGQFGRADGRGRL
jgi:hypothetical protein